MITVMSAVETIREVGIGNDTIATMMTVVDDIRDQIGIDAKVTTVLIDETMAMTADRGETTAITKDATRIALIGRIEDVTEAEAAAGIAATDTEDAETVVHHHRHHHHRAKVLEVWCLWYGIT